MSAMKRIADGAHKVVVTGLFGSFCYTSFGIGTRVMEGKSDTAMSQAREQEHPQAGFIQMLRDKAEEEYKKYYKTDHREWYDKDVSFD